VDTFCIQLNGDRAQKVVKFLKKTSREPILTKFVMPIQGVDIDSLKISGGGRHPLPQFWRSYRDFALSLMGAGNKELQILKKNTSRQPMATKFGIPTQGVDLDF
jgi:hypothetical protein